MPQNMAATLRAAAISIKQYDQTTKSLISRREECALFPARLFKARLDEKLRPVCRNCRPIDETGVVGCQEYDAACDFLGFPQTTGGDL